MLMTFLIPPLGLRVRHHSGTISVFLRIMMAIFIPNLRIIRTYRLILKSNMFPRLKVRFLRMISKLIEEVFRLLLADTFPRKTEEFWEGTGQDLPLSWRLGDYQKSISLPQSRLLLTMAVDCLNESLEASEVDGSFPMPPTFTQDRVSSRADIKSQLSLDIIKLIIMLS